MDLVFFPDAIINLIKISRIIRNPGGNMMLVIQRTFPIRLETLLRWVLVAAASRAWLNLPPSLPATERSRSRWQGWPSFTLNYFFLKGLTTPPTFWRTWRISSAQLEWQVRPQYFCLEVLKLPLQAQEPLSSSQTRTSRRRSTVWSLTRDPTSPPQGFLEYINNVLAGGLLSSLFSREEQSEIIAELVQIFPHHHNNDTKIQSTPWICRNVWFSQKNLSGSSHEERTA